ANLAAMLVDKVGALKPEPEVEAALKRLKDAQFVRETEEGYKLQTAQEKNWETERRGHLAPRPKERNEIKRKVLQDVFAEAKVKTYRYKDLRSFSVGIAVDGAGGDDGNVTLSILAADDDADRAQKLSGAQSESRQASHKDDVYWVFALTPEVDDLIASLHAS